MAFTPSPATRLLQFRTSGPRSHLAYTVDRPEEGSPTSASHPELVGLATQTAGTDAKGAVLPYIYRLLTLQAPDERLDDRIDTYAPERSRPGRPFIFPCALQGSLLGARIDALEPRRPGSVFSRR